MKGYASYCKCWNQIEAEIGFYLTCLGCGRVFRIPDELQYRTKRHVKKQTLLQSLSVVPFMAPLNDSGRKNGDPISFSAETRFDVQPINGSDKIKGKSILEMLSGAENFVRWLKPDLFVEENKVVVVADILGLREDNIRVEIREDRLLITSRLRQCGYEEEIPIPIQTEGKIKTTFNNGLLVIEIY